MQSISLKLKRKKKKSLSFFSFKNFISNLRYRVPVGIIILYSVIPIILIPIPLFHSVIPRYYKSVISRALDEIHKFYDYMNFGS